MHPPKYPFDDVCRNWLSPDEARWPADLRLSAPLPSPDRNAVQSVLWEIGLVIAVPLGFATCLFLCLKVLSVA